MNSVVSDSKRTADELCAEISNFLHNKNLNVADLIYLKNMLKQLNQQKSNMPNKVLRSIEKKLQNLQQQYQR